MEKWEEMCYSHTLILTCCSNSLTHSVYRAIGPTTHFGIVFVVVASYLGQHTFSKKINSSILLLITKYGSQLSLLVYMLQNSSKCEALHFSLHIMNWSVASLMLDTVPQVVSQATPLNPKGKGVWWVRVHWLVPDPENPAWQIRFEIWSCASSSLSNTCCMMI